MNCKKYFEKTTFSKLLCKISDLYSYALTSSILLSLFLQLDLTHFLLLLGTYYLLDRLYYLYGSHINYSVYTTSIFLLTFFICINILNQSHLPYFQKLIFALSLSFIILLFTMLYINMIKEVRENIRCIN